MKGVREFKATDFPKAIIASFESDLVVVRGLVTPDRAARLAAFLPTYRQKKVILMPFGRIHHIVDKAIPTIQQARSANNGWVQDNLHTKPFRNLNPAEFTRDFTDAHVDVVSTVNNTSVELISDYDQPTKFFGERIALATDPYSKIEAAREAHPGPPDYSTDLNIGDAVVIGRGVLHASEAGIDRVALVLDTGFASYKHPELS